MATVTAISRKTIPKEVETQVLVASRRRCCLCYFLDEKRTECKGQIAHLNQNRARVSFADLVYLCLNHHDEFDSSTRLSKGLTPHEVRHHRDELYKKLGTRAVASRRARGKLGKALPPASPMKGTRPEHLAFLDKPWRFRLLVEDKPELFAYKAGNGFDGVCAIERIDLEDGRTAIICEEIDGNPGQSITNSIEHIATQLCDQFDIEPEMLVLIEHYDTWYARETEWDIVEFGRRSRESGFADPAWHPLSPHDWKMLGFRPRLTSGRPRARPKSLVIRSARLRLP
ncbi:MAG: hypothetical protein Q7R32_10715 [Dehalococcoidia bacterium]|nr:hypothetical protein [Dehalococcoidia bacterium]